MGSPRPHRRLIPTHDIRHSIPAPQAYVHALASTRQLNRLNTYLVAASVAYCVAVVALLGPFGTVGLIWANCLNMALRIASSAYFIAEFQVNTPKCNLHPNPNINPGSRRRLQKPPLS